jgi:hypothetical protein
LRGIRELSELSGVSLRGCLAKAEIGI